MPKNLITSLMKSITILMLIVTSLMLTGCNNNKETKVTNSTNETTESKAEIPDSTIGGGSAIENPIEGLPENYIPYNINGFKYAFGYPDYYYVAGNAGNNEDDIAETVALTHKNYIDQNVDTGEGFPSIEVIVFSNPKKQSLTEFATEKNTSTNYANINMKSDEKITKLDNGLEFLSYKIDGLYTFDYYLIANGPYVYVFFATYNDETETTKKDIVGILNTLKFY